MRHLATLLVLLACALPAADFNAEAQFDGDIVAIFFVLPKRVHITAATLRLNAPDGTTVTPVDHPPVHEDGTWPADTVLKFRVTPPTRDLTITLQGCTEEMCFPPQTIPLAAAPAAAPTSAAADAPSPLDGLGRWSAVAGYQGESDFARWLDDAVGNAHAAKENLLARVFRRHGLLLAALLIIPLGLLLNLTPCVLPMIPITLGVLGAGAAGHSRRRGLALGATYGGAMALTYGIAGAVFVHAGGRFGALNASPWFNFAVAVVFIVLALAMFDLILIDLSRFRKGGAPSARGSYAAAAILGATAAILAGACIAPVLIWVLLLAAQLHRGGHAAAAWLPLLLGLGLALPWPFLGAGLSFLPRPGAWMNRVKHAFGVLILAFACFYAWSGFRLLKPAAPPAAPDGRWRTDLAAAAAEARAAQKPLFLDFWGTTCKACVTMDATTLRAPAIQKRLDQMVCVKIQADDFEAPAIRPLAQKFGLLGLPAYVVVLPAP